MGALIAAFPLFGCDGFIHQHPALSMFIGMWVLSNFAGALPKPWPGAPASYVVFFALVHSVAGAIPRIAALLLPPQFARFFLISGKDVDAGAGMPDKKDAPQQNFTG
jgi:hypothetical protein